MFNLALGTLKADDDGIVTKSISTPVKKNIVTHFCKYFRIGFNKNAVNLNEA
jgi:hypothetical protein